MKFVLAFAVIISMLSRITGALKCYQCSDGNFDGEKGSTPPCYLTPGTTLEPRDCGTDDYCKTRFTIQDGLITSVSRNCDSSSSASSSSESCSTTLSTWSDPTAETTCEYLCKTDKCNSQTSDSLKTCASACNIGNSGGRCDYITGSCVCNVGFSGAECKAASTPATTTKRKCVQCNSLTDNTCTSTAASASATVCEGGERYCSTTTTSIYDSSEKVQQTVYTRGCTDNFVAVDECSFTNIYYDQPLRKAGYNEFTCYSTCGTDGCNTNTADGKINGNEKADLQCVQCSDLTGDGSCDAKTERTLCPSSSNFCETTINYMISKRSDYPEAVPSYKLVSLVRKCADSAVERKCTSSTPTNSLSYEKVTCTESCHTDGCNTGWPARPKCVQCSSAPSVSGYDSCLKNPSTPEGCDYPYQEYCVIQESGIQTGGTLPIDGYPHEIIRGCSHYNIGTGCSVTKPRSTEIATCNRTCTTDGCNVGSGTTMPVQTMIGLIAPVVLAWLAQSNL